MRFEGVSFDELVLLGDLVGVWEFVFFEEGGFDAFFLFDFSFLELHCCWIRTLFCRDLSCDLGLASSKLTQKLTSKIQIAN